MVKYTANLPLDAHSIFAFEDMFPAGYIDPPHSHTQSQLSFSLSGVMSVVTEDASYILPPDRAIWIPAEKKHEVSCRGKMRFQVVYIDPTLGTASENCRVFDVSPLVRGLIHEATKFDADYKEEGREERIIQLLLEEIERMPELSVRAIMPNDERLRRVCDAIIATPSDRRDIDAWAKHAGMGRRTFTRLFKEQTGMGLGVWRQQVRLMEAVSRLSSGQSITTVAFEVGYESPSAFASMFQRAFGAPPSTFRKS